MKPQLKSLAPLFDAARSFAKQSGAPKEARLAALRLLGRGFDQREADLKLLAALLVPQTAAEVQSAAIAALGKLRSPEVPDLLLRGWKRYAPPLRAQALDVLLARPDWLGKALDAVEKQQIAPLEIDAARRQRLLEHKTAAVRERAARLLAGAVSPDRQKIVDHYRVALAIKSPDRGRGEAVFKRACAACHQLGGVGQQVGPDLAPFSSKNPEELLIAIFDPNRAVDARYVNYTATTKAGVSHSGMLATETATSITLVGADGKSQTILRADLEDLYSSGKSVMPEGLEKDLKLEEVADLLAFLRAAKTSLHRPGWETLSPLLVHVTTGLVHPQAQKKSATTYTPVAPSLPALNEREVAQIERIIDRFILFEAGKLKGKDAVLAVVEFKELGREAIPQLIEGLNRAAQEGNSCAAVLIAKKLGGLLGASEDHELLDFARENIGAGVTAKRHMNILKDLRLGCQLRKSALQREQLAYAKVELDKKPLRVLTVKELAEAAGSASGARLKTVLSEIEQRQDEAVLRVLVSALDSSDAEITTHARTLLAKHVARQSPIAIQSRLRDERPDVRIAAAQAVARKRLLLGEELIALLKDTHAEVRQAARQALVQLAGGTDHGPERGANDAETERAIRAWRAWWQQQSKAGQ